MAAWWEKALLIWTFVLLAGICNAETFPILAWGPSEWFKPRGQAVTVDQFREMKECGFTTAGFAMSVEELDRIHEAGLKAYYFAPELAELDWQTADPRTFPELAQKIVERVGTHPGLAGYHLADEPRESAFANLAAMRQALRDAAPGCDTYVNLFPNYAYEEPEYEKDAYEKYLQNFINVFHPDWLSYDFYTLMEDPKNERSRLNEYYLNLAQARDATQRAGIPLAVCTLATAHWGYRVPSIDDLHFEVYSALLYGAKRLAIFTYFTPVLANFREAPIDEFGYKSPVWYAMRTTLAGVQARAGLWQKLKSTRVYHIPVVDGERGTAGPDADSLITHIVSEANLAVGEFIDSESGEQYVLILNKNLLRSTSLVISWRKLPARVEINPVSRPGEWHTWNEGENGIAPGHALLLRVTPKK